MLIIIARIEFDPDRMDDIEPALDAMMRATWEESGCLSYSMAIENRALGICSITERWESEASLKSHFASPHMATFLAAIDGAARSTDAMMYDVVNERPLVL
ncbi:MAG: putative quinol monooxygenase [Polymorphobacter sp.]